MSEISSGAGRTRRTLLAAGAGLEDCRQVCTERHEIAADPARGRWI